MKKLIYTLAAIGLGTGAAYAQAGPEPAPAPVPGAEAAPVPANDAPPAGDADAGVTADAAATASANYTDAEIDSFAQATVKVRAINTDASIAADQKQAQMAAAVAEVGLDPVKYNEIAKATATDEALRTKVQVAMARHAQPGEG